MPEFKFPLGSLVNDLTRSVIVDGLVVGQVSYINGCTGYVVSAASRAHGAIIRHIVDECEINLSEFQP